MQGKGTLGETTVHRRDRRRGLHGHAYLIAVAERCSPPPAGTRTRPGPEGDLELEAPYFLLGQYEGRDRLPERLTPA